MQPNEPEGAILRKIEIGAMRIFLLLLLLLLFAGEVRAGETERRAQEELRRRNLFFGDVDGQATPELSTALRLYQTHKGFPPTGKIDADTARSLGIVVAGDGASAILVSAATKWPDLPVLKSDAARALSPATRAAIEKRAVANLDVEPSPEIPAEPPSPAQNLDPEKVTNFVQSYLRANETNDLERQLDYYAFPVDYFTHGEVGKAFVTKDNRRYMQRWPERKYELSAPVKFAAGPRAGETVVQFPISFKVRNSHHQVSGTTRNFWTIRPDGGGLKIFAIREERAPE